MEDAPPARRTPAVTYALAAASAAAFVWQLGAGLDVSAFRGGAIPYEILTLSDVDLPDYVPPPFTLLTGMFLHAGFLHVLSNLVFLWLFGGDVEAALGRPRFALLYFAAGVVAALVQIVAAAAAGELLVPVVGSSGAIAGVLAAYVALSPRARGFGALVIVAWFGLQVLSVVFGGTPGVAHFAHVGGFVAGWLLVRAAWRSPAGRARRAPG